MGIISVLMIALGLAMDSLAVSISGGIVMQPFRMNQSLRLAFTMGIFQGGMTLLGWLLGVSFSSSRLFGCRLRIVFYQCAKQ